MTNAGTAVAPGASVPRPAATSPVYTEEEEKQMAHAQKIEHFMNVVVAFIIVLPVVPSIIFFAMGAWFNWIQGTLCLVITGIFLGLFLKEVKAAPKQVGVRGWLGARIPLLKQEGYHLTIPYLWDLIRVDVTDKNTDLSQEEVATKDGQVGVDASMTWRPNYNNPFDMIRYIDAGGVNGIEDITDDPIREGVRDFAIIKDTDDLLKDKAGLRKKIIDILGKTEDRTLRTAFKNGKGHLYLKLVGIEILQITVPEIVLPDSIKVRRNEMVNEKYDRAKEVTERDHNVESINKYVTESKLPPAAAAEVHLISQEKIVKSIHEEEFNVKGLNSRDDPFGLLKAAQIWISGNREGGKGRNKDKNKGQGRK